MSLIGSNQGEWHTNHKQKLGLLSWPPFSFMYSPFTTFPSPSNCSIILSWSSQSFRTFNRPHYTENYTPLKGCSQIHVQAHHLQKKVKQDLYSNARSILPHCTDADKNKRWQNIVHRSSSCIFMKKKRTQLL